jgi:ABC-type glycerol-3-phosphate transport system substrate-binding protein
MTLRSLNESDDLGASAPRPFDYAQGSGRARVGLIAICVLLVACGGERSESRERPLIYWEKWTGFEDQAMGEVVEAFNQAQRERAAQEPSYRPIVVRKVTTSRIEQKLLVAIASGHPPDLAGVFSYLLASYVEKGALTDLTDLAARAGIDESHYAPKYWELARHRGRLWALPTTPSTLALHWNPRLFSEAGLDPERPPATLEELERYAEALTRWEVIDADGITRVRSGYLPDVLPEKKRLIQVGFLPSEPGFWHWSWGYYFGGQLVDGERITTASPENIRAFEWVASFSKRLGVDKLQRFRSGFGSFASPQNPFMVGKVAMELQGVWMSNFIERYAPGMPWRAGPFPHPADRPDLAGANDVEADLIVIPKDAPRPDEAFEFIRFLSSQEMMERLCRGQKKHSPLRVTSTQFLEGHPHPYVSLFQELAYSSGAFRPPQVGVYNEYLRELGAAADDIINLRVDPKAALTRVQGQIQTAYDRELRIVRRRGPHAF